ncbi:MAG: integrase [Oceanospirillaceae bacterium]|nr:integrase [Oceanospirillaceae bacterium]
MQAVEAAKTTEQIQRIEMALSDNHGQVYADLWKIGLNLALRISDLLSLTYEDVSGEKLKIVEGKTNKLREIVINQAARQVIERRRARHPDHIYLFQSDSNRSRTMIKPIDRSVVSRKFKEVGEQNSIKMHLNTHSMRKTRGWMMHQAGVSIEQICKVLNHSSPAVTMAYIGITQADIDRTYDEFCL